MRKIQLLGFISLLFFAVSTVNSQILDAPMLGGDPAYNQINFINRLNKWNIQQLGIQIMMGRVQGGKGKQATMSDEQLKRIIENSKKINTYNSAPSVTKFKNTGKSIIPSMYIKEANPNDIDRIVAIGTMQKALDQFFKTSMEDHFESDDLAWAMTYFLMANYLVYHDAARPRLNPGVITKIKPEVEAKIYQRFKQSLSEDPAVQKMTDVEKQMAAENLVIMGGTTLLYYSVKADEMSMENIANGVFSKAVTPEEREKQVEEIKQRAKENLEKVLNVPADSIKITNDSFEF